MTDKIYENEFYVIENVQVQERNIDSSEDLYSIRNKTTGNVEAMQPVLHIAVIWANDMASKLKDLFKGENAILTRPSDLLIPKKH